MKKTGFFVLMFVVVIVLAGCATTKRGIWQGDWNPGQVKWVAETYLDGDVPRTMIETKSGTVLIFQ